MFFYPESGDFLEIKGNQDHCRGLLAKAGKKEQKEHRGPLQDNTERHRTGLWRALKMKMRCTGLVLGQADSEEICREGSCSQNNRKGACYGGWETTVPAITDNVSVVTQVPQSSQISLSCSASAI